MTVSRRQLLAWAAVGGVGLAVPGGLRVAAPVGAAPPPGAGTTPIDGATLTRWAAALPTPPSGLPVRMAESVHTFHPDLGPSPTWGYGGATYLGPTVEAQSGAPLAFTVDNDLGPHILRVDPTTHGARPSDQSRPRTSLHKHGGYTASAYDGLPEDVFSPGETHVYSYGNAQQAATLWYHDHALGITRLNVYAGLAGFYLLRDGYDTGAAGNAAGLPTGDYEVPIVIQDKIFARVTSTGETVQSYPFPWAPEFFGDTAVLNGVAWPEKVVAPAVYRFRLLNGSSSRFYALELHGGGRMLAIGTDGGLLPAPAPIGEPGHPLVIAPGERWDVLVDLNGLGSGGTVHLVDVALPAPAVSPAVAPLGQILRLRVGDPGHNGTTGPVPASFSGFQRMDAGDATQVGTPPRPLERNVSLVEILGGPHPKVALLNNLHWDTTQSTWEQPHAETAEIWNIHNTTADTHPIHLHLVQFQLLERVSFDPAAYLQQVYGRTSLRPGDAGRGPWPPPAGTPTGAPEPLPLHEVGWKDTVQAHPGQITRIVVPFSKQASAKAPYTAATPLTGEYVWHCHILDHEDHEMMLPYQVLPGGVPLP